MILDRPAVDAGVLHARTGWEWKPEGLCRADSCVPLPEAAVHEDGTLDPSAVADRLGMPLLHDEDRGLFALGPEGGGRVITDARLPELTLPDLDGNPFSLSSLHGQKVLLVAWASW